MFPQSPGKNHPLRAAAAAGDIIHIVAVGTFAILLNYGLANFEALRLKSPSSKRARCASAGGLATCAGLLVFVGGTALKTGLAILAAGVLFYLAKKGAKASRQRRAIDR
jgi:hypothetical protein